MINQLIKLIWIIGIISITLYIGGIVLHTATIQVLQATNRFNNVLTINK